MSVETLRKAAEKLREQSNGATQGPWNWEQYRDDLPFLVGSGGDPATYKWSQEVIEAEHHGECGCRYACRLELTVRREDQAYIAMMHPGVGRALAVHLDALATFLESFPPQYADRIVPNEAFDVASQIIGDAS